MKNIKLIIAYDGNDYLGWQITKVGPSIEGTLQPIIEKVLQHPVILQAASRTDAGVHAVGQVVNFFTEHLIKNLNQFIISLNRLLPKSIVVLKAEKMEANFHPTLDCKGKEYRYFICYGALQLPQHRFYSWHYHYPLNLEEMRRAAHALQGTHDFAAFCKTRKNDSYSHYIRTVEKIEILELEEKRLCIVIKGNNFLYKMVRNIVGTLAYSGNHKLDASKMHEILQSKKREHAGVTAPAHGLFLQQVFYL